MQRKTEEGISVLDIGIAFSFVPSCFFVVDVRPPDIALERVKKLIGYGITSLDARSGLLRKLCHNPNPSKLAIPDYPSK